MSDGVWPAARERTNSRNAALCSGEKIRTELITFERAGSTHRRACRAPWIAAGVRPSCLAIIGIERARFRMIAIICSSALLYCLPAIGTVHSLAAVGARLAPFLTSIRRSWLPSYALSKILFKSILPVLIESKAPGDRPQAIGDFRGSAVVGPRDMKPMLPGRTEKHFP